MEVTMKSTSALLRRASLAIVVTVLAALVADASVSAAPPTDHGVDPGTLVPPPPDFFNAACRQAGRQILCSLAFTDPVSPAEEPTGLICGSGPDAFELLDTWT